MANIIKYLSKLFRKELMDAIYQLITGFPGLIKRTLKNEDFQFRLRTSAEIILIPCISLASTAVFVWFTLKINLIYLLANGY